MSVFTPSEAAKLRRAAAQLQLSGSVYRGWSIGKCLKHLQRNYQLVRNSSGEAVGFAREGMLYLSSGFFLFTWHERRAYEQAIESA